MLALDVPRSAGPRRPALRRCSILVTFTLGVGCAGMSAASAQGSPVGGTGNQYFLAGAGDVTGVAQQQFSYGDSGDEVYFGDFTDVDGSMRGDGRDDAMVRRGNVFSIRGQAGRTFVYGDPGDTVLVGDWDGDGTDTLAVRRGNTFFVKNDVHTGVADHTFVYGDPTDTVLVGNWDGDTSRAGAHLPLTTDTLMVRRGNHYFVKNSTSTGAADHDFYFGEPSDTVLVGDWASAPANGRVGESGDYADALAVRRGNTYFLSDEVWRAQVQGSGSGLGTLDSFVYGEATDTAFTALLAGTYQVDGRTQTVHGDGIGVRRAGAADTAGTPVESEASPMTDPVGVRRTYAAVGDSITSGMGEYWGLSTPGPTSWLTGETAQTFELVGGWAVPAQTTTEMRANVQPTTADVLVLLGGTNDLLRGVPWTTTEANLRAISATVGARDTLLVGIVPLTDHPAERAAFNARLAALAGEEGWRYVDPWAPVAVQDAWAPAATFDGIHPTPQAAADIGAAISDAAWRLAARRPG